VGTRVKGKQHVPNFQGTVYGGKEVRRLYMDSESCTGKKDKLSQNSAPYCGGRLIKWRRKMGVVNKRKFASKEGESIKTEGLRPPKKTKPNGLRMGGGWQEKQIPGMGGDVPASTPLLSSTKSRKEYRGIYFQKFGQEGVQKKGAWQTRKRGKKGKLYLTSKIVRGSNKDSVLKLGHGMHWERKHFLAR